MKKTLTNLKYTAVVLAPAAVLILQTAGVKRGG